MALKIPERDTWLSTEGLHIFVYVTLLSRSTPLPSPSVPLVTHSHTLQGSPSVRAAPLASVLITLY